MNPSKMPDVLRGMHAWLEATVCKPRCVSQTPGNIGDIGTGPSSSGLAAQHRAEITEVDSALCELRARRLIANGVAKQEAERLARRLLQRDRSRDDRKSCAECSSYVGGTCMQRLQPFGGGGIFALHRCAGFREAGQ